MSASRRFHDHPVPFGRVLGEPTYNPAPGSVPPPGETLLEWLQKNRRSQAWLAEMLGSSPKHVNRIVRGHTSYTAETALRLAEVTGVQAKFWMYLQADYQLNQALLARRKGPTE